MPAPGDARDDRRMRRALTVGLFLVAGCGRTSGFLRDANSINEHQFRMEIAARRYARSVSGSLTIGFFFCMIPMKNGAYKDAMAALHAEAKLQTNEVIENIREDHAFIAYVFYCEDRLIISADVYEVAAVATPAQAQHAHRSECDPPYSIDFEGRMIFKRECVSSDQFKPSDPYKPPPPNPYAPGAPDVGDAGAFP